MNGDQRPESEPANQPELPAPASTPSITNFRNSRASGPELPVPQAPVADTSVESMDPPARPNQYAEPAFRSAERSYQQPDRRPVDQLSDQPAEYAPQMQQPDMATQPIPSPYAIEDAPLPQPQDMGDVIEWAVTGEQSQHRAGPARQVAFTYGGVALVIAIVYLITRDLFAVIAIAFAVGLLVLINKRKPTTTRYRVDYGGIAIGQRRYDYSQFRSFAVEETSRGEITISLMPLKRFMPLLSMNIDQANSGIQSQVVERLSSQLPQEVRHRDAIDALIQKLHF